MSLSATSPCLSNHSRNGHPTTSLGSQSQCLTTLLGKKFFLIPYLNPPWCHLRPVPFCPITCYLREKMLRFESWSWQNAAEIYYTECCEMWWLEKHLFCQGKPILKVSPREKRSAQLKQEVFKSFERNPSCWL